MKYKGIFIVITIIFIIIVASSIFSLTVNALDNGHPEDDDKWEIVCCGPACGIRFCLGNGKYACCD